MEATIERGIPMANAVGRGKISKFPFADMKKGDSFAVDDETQLKSARNAAYRYRLANPKWDYGTVKYPDGSGRLWRTQ